MSDIFVTLLWWMVYSGLVSGIGALTMQAIGIKAKLLPYAFWLGWAATTILLQIWHLFAPINILCWLLFAGAGIVGLITNWRGFAAAIRQVRPGKLLLLAWSGLLLWVVFKSVIGIPLYDTGLYHLSAVKWSHEYAIIAGLGNLHGRLAFNSTHLLFGSLLSVFPGEEIAYHILNGLLLAALMSHILWEAHHIIRTQEPAASHIFSLFMLPVILLLTSGGTLASFSTDLPIDLLTILTFLVFLKLIDLKDNSPSLLYVGIIILMGVTIKLSFAVFGLSIGLFALWIRRHHMSISTRDIMVFVMSGVLLVGIWAIRGVILSGYPAYPITAGAMPVTWRIPIEMAVSEANAILSHARIPHSSPAEVLGNRDWLSLWFQANSSSLFSFRIPLVLLVGLIGLTGYGIMRGRRIEHAAISIQPIFPILIALIFWFFTAPDIRFASTLIWLPAAYFGVYVFLRFSWSAELKSRSVIILILGLCGIITYSLLRNTSFDQLSYSQLPEVIVEAYVAESNLSINVPKFGDSCWDAPIPCTPYFNPELQLIEDGNLQSGFMIRANRK